MPANEQFVIMAVLMLLLLLLFSFIRVMTQCIYVLKYFSIGQCTSFHLKMAENDSREVLL